MKSRIPAAIVAAALLLSVGRAEAKVLVVPTAANLPGKFGAYFKTRLTILPLPSTNPAHQKFGVTLQVLPPSGGQWTRSLVVNQGVLTVIDNVFETMGYAGGGGLEILYPEGQVIFVTAEVYTDGPGGRYSTAVPVIGTSDQGQLEAASWNLSIGVNNDADNRTNIGCSLLESSTGAASVYAEVHQADGSFVGALEFTVPSYGWNQTSVPFPVTNGYVTFSGGGFCYAVNVNNRSNDGTLLH